MAYTDATSKIIIKGAPFAYLVPIKTDETGLVETVSGTKDIYGFNNIGDPSIKSMLPDSESASSEYIDVTRCDGAITRFPKPSVIINGTTGEPFVEGSTGGTSTDYGEITLIANAAPVGSTGCITTVDTMTKLLKFMQTNRTNKFLVVVATGFNYNGYSSSTPAVDGWAYMVGKISADLELAPSSGGASSLTLTFASNSTTTAVGTALTSLTFPALTFYDVRNSSFPDTDYTVTAPAITSATDLVAGKILFTPTTA